MFSDLFVDFCNAPPFSERGASADEVPIFTSLEVSRAGPKPFERVLIWLRVSRGICHHGVVCSASGNFAPDRAITMSA